jgi:hypothetical protein
MYEDAKKEIDKILELVSGMPEALQARGFEILLGGYVASLQSPLPASKSANEKQLPSSDTAGQAGIEAVPQELRNRLKTLAGQAGVTVDALVNLFDFAVDPFTLGSFVLPGSKTADKARKLALLVAARSYIANGKWTADWNEVKAACVDHSCYDSGNFSNTMSKGKGGVFKSVNVGTSIELAATGQAEAKALLASLATDAAK